MLGHDWRVHASAAAVVALTACGARTELEALQAAEVQDASARDAAAARDTGSRDAVASDACGRGPVVLEVPVTAPWFDTGLDVTLGSRLVIKTTGVVRYGGVPQQVTDANGIDFTGQKLFPMAVYPTTVIVSLIGKVGGSVAIDTGTPLPEGTPGDGPGFVGISYDQVVPVSGRLFLGFNDQRNAFGDNSGTFTATITIEC